MGNDSPRLTGPTLKILGALMGAPLKGFAGADLSKQTGIASGTLYPILFRLEKAGWLTSEWEDVNPSEIGRPRKRLYTVTSIGLEEAEAAFRSILPGTRRFAWET
jgi:DNA-binding PadR family transcriptional regulator